MAVYEYQGLDAGGKPTSGIIDADNPKAARVRIRQLGVFPTDISEQTGTGQATKGTGLAIEIDFSRLFIRIKAGGDGQQAIHCRAHSHFACLEGVLFFSHEHIYSGLAVDVLHGLGRHGERLGGRSAGGQ